MVDMKKMRELAGLLCGLPDAKVSLAPDELLSLLHVIDEANAERDAANKRAETAERIREETMNEAIRQGSELRARAETAERERDEAKAKLDGARDALAAVATRDASAAVAIDDAEAKRREATTRAIYLEADLETARRQIDADRKAAGEIRTMLGGVDDLVAGVEALVRVASTREAELGEAKRLRDEARYRCMKMHRRTQHAESELAKARRAIGDGALVMERMSKNASTHADELARMRGERDEAKRLRDEALVSFRAREDELERAQKAEVALRERVAEVERELDVYAERRDEIATILGSVHADTGEWLDHGSDVGAAEELAKAETELRAELDAVKRERDARPRISASDAARCAWNVCGNEPEDADAAERIEDALVEHASRHSVDDAEEPERSEEPSGLARLIDAKIAAALDAYRVGEPVDIVVDVSIRGREPVDIGVAPMRLVFGSDEDFEEDDHGR